MSFLDDLRKKIDDIGARLNPASNTQQAQPDIQFLFNAKAQANLNQNQPAVNGHAFNYATPDAALTPRQRGSTVTRDIGGFSPQLPAAPGGSLPIAGFNPSQIGVYGGTRSYGGQKWYENDATGQRLAPPTTFDAPLTPIRSNVPIITAPAVSKPVQRKPRVI